MIKKKEKEISRKLLNEIKVSISKLFRNKKLNKNGEEKLKTIFSLAGDFALYMDAPGFLFQVYLAENFKNYFYKKTSGSLHKKEESFNTLLSSHHLTNYELFINEIYKKRNKKRFFKRITAEYYWLTHDYIGTIIDEKYISKVAREMLKDKEYFNKNIKPGLSRVKYIKRFMAEIPKDVRNRIRIVADIMYLYNDRKKAVMNRVNIFIRSFIERKFPGVSVSKIRLFYQLTPEEIINLLKDKKINYKERNENWGYEIFSGRYKKADRKYFALFGSYKNVKTLSGSPASLGKIKGKVNIVLNISHIHLFKSGNILVAPFTNVNYLPIMNRAKAIITDTGGLTSHAAIVSRELKIPCIVGTKIATQVLRDGQLVEVDANKGIVKIIK